MRSAWLTAVLMTAALSTARAGSPKLETVEIDAPSVARKMKFNVSLPDGYAASGEKRYPVVYLLHGLTSNYTAWDKLGAGKAADGLDLIVVMPDVGNSWYCNWAENKEGQKNDWEDFIIKDLITYVDQHYRTIARREGRAINGLSMGGYGALMLGLRHPDLFASVGSQSGALGIAKGAAEAIRNGRDLSKMRREPSDREDASIGVADFDSQRERTPKGTLFVKVEDAEKYDPFKLVLEVPKDRLPHLCIDCGTEDGLIRSNEEFLRILLDNKIPFTYSQSPGGHVPAYWAREIGHALAVQATILRRELAKAEAAAAAK
ncbi:MAG: alpha/beta hydrolase family protein [Isosphaeraceae bacterium]|nr:alpha/beta hydrolase family protein [Isosphaeraceae bacterium]